MKVALAIKTAPGLITLMLLPIAALGGFLPMEEGARATAMGGAFIGVADDASAVFWNPAGYGLTQGLKLMGMRTRLFAMGELSEDCVAVSYSGTHRAGFGFGWASTGLQDIYNEDTFVLGGGRRFLLDGLAIGAAFRVYRASAPGYEYYNDPNFKNGDTGYAGDVGLLYKGRNWSIACVARNLGEPELKMIRTTEASDPVSSEIRVGGTYVFREVMLLSGEIRRAADAPSYYDGRTSYYLGTEIWFYDAFALRSGLHRDRATAGVGLRIQNLTVDAALVSDRRPGNKYRLALTLDF